MIVKRIWSTRKRGNFYYESKHWNYCESGWEGYFLFGVLPLFIKNTRRLYHQ